jgi:hypothetical protein
MARNPSYPGAGITMYALFSDYLAMPITSDRGSSTSTATQPNKLFTKYYKGVEG